MQQYHPKLKVWIDIAIREAHDSGLLCIRINNWSVARYNEKTRGGIAFREFMQEFAISRRGNRDREINPILKTDYEWGELDYESHYPCKANPETEFENGFNCCFRKKENVPLPLIVWGPSKNSISQRSFNFNLPW